jgi:aspartate carbamoyltransferase catalytic subunit
MEKLRHVLSNKQFEDPELLEYLFTSAEQLERDDAARMLDRSLQGRILATIFYEPSTRTRFSFESAMQKLGGGLLTQENASDNSSAAKGETIADTIRVVGNYADAIVIRRKARQARPRRSRRCPSSTRATARGSIRRRRCWTCTRFAARPAALTACAWPSSAT